MIDYEWRSVYNDNERLSETDNKLDNVRLWNQLDNIGYNKRLWKTDYEVQWETVKYYERLCEYEWL